MTKKDYINIARRVMDYYKFSYFAPRGWAIVQCAKYVEQMHRERANYSAAKVHLLPIIAKHFYISENNKAYYQYVNKKTVPALS